MRATNEVADWVSRQLELADVEVSRSRMMEAEVRALRAQISPHFIYNSLSAIASFVRTDPERARELLLEFADFTRYSFRRHGEFTTLAEELRSIERYLVLEKARFGERLQVTLRVAPEALGVTLPFLSLQPLVENAVRHGLEAKPSDGQTDDHRRERRGRRRDHGGGRRRRRGSRAGTARAGRRRNRRLGRLGQRRRAAAQHVRAAVRTGDRDRGRRRHEGDGPGAQVRARACTPTSDASATGVRCTGRGDGSSRRRRARGPGWAPAPTTPVSPAG